jgi:hypothetical protein
VPKPAITTFSSVLVSQSNTNINNGLYAPQLTPALIAEIPAATLINGAIIYNTSINLFQVYVNGEWVNIFTTPDNAGNLVVPSNNTNPVNPVNGELYYNTATNQFTGYANGMWITIISGGDVIGPGASIVGNIATFANVSGKLLQDSGLNITRVLIPLESLNKRKSIDGLSELLGEGYELTDLNSIQFINEIGLIYVSDQIAVEFLTQTLSLDPLEYQVCTLFTGNDVGEVTTPSALLEVQTTTGAILVSRLNETQVSALVSPVDGMILYNTTTNRFQTYENNSWLSSYAPGYPTYLIPEHTIFLLVLMREIIF